MENSSRFTMPYQAHDGQSVVDGHPLRQHDPGVEGREEESWEAEVGVEGVEKGGDRDEVAQEETLDK